MKFLFSVLFFILLLSCKPNQQSLEKDIIGIWVSDTTNLSSKYLVKSKYFLRKFQGYKFKKDGELIVRQNSGWCGTPPIMYKNYDGTWKLTSDSLIITNFKYWGGTVDQNFKVTKLTSNQLYFKTIYRKTNKDK